MGVAVSTESISTQCLCGSVKVQTTSLSDSLGACHCGMCRKWGGGPAITVEAKDIEFKGDEHIGNFISSDWAERGFCKNCGTHLYYRLRENQHYYLPAFLFEQAAELPFTHQVFIDQKPTNYDFANQTKNMTQAEVFEAFSSDS